MIREPARTPDDWLCPEGRLELRLGGGDLRTRRHDPCRRWFRGARMQLYADTTITSAQADVVCDPDVLLPVQDPPPPVPLIDGWAHLCAALIESAVCDAMRPIQPWERRPDATPCEARAWFRGAPAPVTFREACDAVGLSAATRARLVAYATGPLRRRQEAA